MTSGDRDFACKWACDSELTHSQQALPLGLESFTLPSQVVACCLLAEHRPLGARLVVRPPTGSNSHLLRLAKKHEDPFQSMPCHSIGTVVASKSMLKSRCPDRCATEKLIPKNPSHPRHMF